MSNTYELPWTASAEQRQLVANMMLSSFRDEIVAEGLEKRVERFIREFGTVPGAYRAKLTIRFPDKVPAEVAGILGSFAEHVSDIRQNDMEQLYNDDTGLADVAIVMAKMAAATAEVRALNDILGL